MLYIPSTDKPEHRFLKLTQRCDGGAKMPRMSKRPACFYPLTSAAAMQSTHLPFDEEPTKKRRKENDIEIDRARGLCGACSINFHSWDAIEPATKALKYHVFYPGCYVVRNHHWHFRVLNESSRRGCRFCALLRQALAHRGYRSPSSFRSRTGEEATDSSPSASCASTESKVASRSRYTLRMSG